MDNFFLTVLLLFIGIVLLVPVVLDYKQSKQKKECPTTSYVDLMGILNLVIQQQIKIKYDEYRLKDVRVVFDFKNDMTTLVVNIMEGLSDDFLSDLYYYHPRAYLMNYIAEQSKGFLVEYTREHKVKTK